MYKVAERAEREFSRTFDKLTGSSIPLLNKIINTMPAVMAKLDKLLDKPVFDDPKYACGDFLEEVLSYAEEVKADIVETKSVMMATALSWTIYPEDLESNEDGSETDKNAHYRYGFFLGYLRDK